MKGNLLLLLASALMLCCADKPDPEPEPDPTPIDTLNIAKVWQTTGDKNSLFANVFNAALAENVPTDQIAEILIDTATTYQEIEGFGASITGSSAYVMRKYLTAAARTKLLEDLFSREKGIGINYIRLTIGASDFSLTNFSYNDTKDDTLMQNFSIDYEKTDLLPVLKEIVAINPGIHIMASPWSPPGWMKTNNSMVGGQMQPKYHRALARYLMKYIQAMQAEGITISALTIQNEPLFGTAGYPCMYMPATEQRDFIKNHLGPMFAQNNITTQIMVYDHNWDHPEYPTTILDDPDAKQYVTGSAFHAYGGDVSAMKVVHEAHPDKGIYFTEQSGGGWAPDFTGNLEWFTQTLVIKGTRNWTQNVLLWNMALDEKSGPKNNGCGDCRGVVTVSSNGTITRNEEYYVLAHAGKFTQPGAKRCLSYNLPTQGIENVVFLNPDGSRVLIAMNTTATDKKFRFRDGKRSFVWNFAPDAIYTFTWKP